MEKQSQFMEKQKAELQRLTLNLDDKCKQRANASV